MYFAVWLDCKLKTYTNIVLALFSFIKKKNQQQSEMVNWIQNQHFCFCKTRFCLIKKPARNAPVLIVLYKEESIETMNIYKKQR